VQTPTTAIKRNSNYDMADVEAISNALMPSLVSSQATGMSHPIFGMTHVYLQRELFAIHLIISGFCVKIPKTKH
jgi:hypothetical protein